VIFWCRNEDSLGGGDQPAGLNGYGACSQATFSQSVTAVGVSYVLDSSRRWESSFLLIFMLSALKPQHALYFQYCWKDHWNFICRSNYFLLYLSFFTVCLGLGVGLLQMEG